MEIILERCNLQKAYLHDIESHFLKLDEGVSMDEEGNVESKKFGFLASHEEGKEGNRILLYSKEYLEEEPVTPDEIISYYLGENYNP